MTGRRGGSHLLPNRPIDLLIKRRAACGKLAPLVVLGAHEGCAIAKRSADTFALKPAMFLQLPGKIGLRQRCAADANKGYSTIMYVCGPSLKQVFLQVAVPAADNRRSGKGALHLLGQAK